MKVGVDGVLLGAWIDCKDSRRILDVGCGCGLIALMAAQRNENAGIDAIDIDSDSVEEAGINFRESLWSSRLHAIKSEFDDFCLQSDVDAKYDYVVSNPPYFDSGINNPDSRRLVARHQSSLSPYKLIDRAPLILADNGRLAMIIPYEIGKEVIEYAEKGVMKVRRILKVSGRERKDFKRLLLEFVKTKGNEDNIETEHDQLFIENVDGTYSNRYIDLCKEFYLKF